MKRSNFARAAAVTGIALGLGAFAVPAASADAIYNEKGDFAVQNAQTNGDNSPIAQAAQIIAELDAGVKGWSADPEYAVEKAVVDIAALAKTSHRR